MARNGSGTYSVPETFSAGQSVSSTRFNANFNDIGSELTNSLPRDGQASMTGQLKAADGSQTAPGITFGSDPNTGFYRASGDTIGVTAGGVQIGTMSAAGLTGAISTVPSGTTMLFVQTAAPTGWTKVTTHDNKALRVVSGTAGSGGTSNFTTVFASRTLSVANLPAHTHGSGDLETQSAGGHEHTYVAMRVDGGSAEGGSGTRAGATPNTYDTSYVFGHEHNIVGNTASTGSGTALDFAVAYVDTIIATKD